ncbi:hypothetical protein E2C01_007842 [Portunus trituberculatus]|uniref:Uncharacterized protein n=1 Tax=Portunus trituberculatus TaxID=210409 RepID=A0A5B7D079_PORTR|nr:hypothetical protein [Portunus trituberculatus]
MRRRGRGRRGEHRDNIARAPLISRHREKQEEEEEEEEEESKDSDEEQYKQEEEDKDKGTVEEQRDEMKQGRNKETDRLIIRKAGKGMKKT